MASVTAVPTFDYVFDQWELDGAPAGTANPTGVTMDADHSLEAVFALFQGTVYIRTDGIVDPPTRVRISPGYHRVTLKPRVSSSVISRRNSAILEFGR
jgi:hypothetical protein